MTTLHLKVKAETSGAAWEITCKDAAITVVNEKLEDGLIELLEKVKTTLFEEIDTTKRIVTRLEDLTATAVITVRFYSDQDLNDFTEASAEEPATTPLLKGAQKCLPAGEDEEWCPLWDREELECKADPAACPKTNEEREDLGCPEIAPIRNVPQELPDDWHPSTSKCQGCVVLGYRRDEGRKTPYHVCTVAGCPPYQLTEEQKYCPCGGPVLSVGCDLWGADTLCHRTPETECDETRMKAAHCPIYYDEALEYMRRQQGRNPQSGQLTATYCKMKECPNLKKREKSNTLECSITGYLPGNQSKCPKEEATP